MTRLKDGKALAKVCYYGTKASGENGFFTQYYPVLIIMIGTGMRVGELLGLTWKDVNMRNAKFMLRRS